MSQPNKMKKRILIIDDDHSIRDAIQHLLEAEGYTIFLADHGKDGLELLRNMEPPCAILLDIQMPIMDGYEFLREKSADPAIANIPVVVLSATADAKDLNGAADFIRKPFSIPQLLGTVEKYFVD